MADHGTVEYATATGNDYTAHESSYERFVHFTLVGILYVVTILFGLATGGVMGHWLLAAAIFVIGLLGVIPGLLSGATKPSYVSFVTCFLIFAFTGLSPH
ncbi:MAG: aa3-type cytochrome c oxidase subunit IV [Sphingobacteriales bacterium]